MGERKGTNKYYPPDYDPKYGGLNKFLGTHALRERARKIDKGIIIIRFEMPYNIWCDGCKNHIGMGVRYNAEKTKVGMYYTTPVYEFKMKCHLCDNHFVIRADPAVSILKFLLYCFIYCHCYQKCVLFKVEKSLGVFICRIWTMSYSREQEDKRKGGIL